RGGGPLPYAARRRQPSPRRGRRAGFDPQRGRDVSGTALLPPELEFLGTRLPGSGHVTPASGLSSPGNRPGDRRRRWLQHGHHLPAGGAQGAPALLRSVRSPGRARVHGLHGHLLLIYFASCAFGTEDIRTSGGYFHLANIFYGLKKLDVADTLYTKVSEIWSKYLNNRYQVLSEARIQQIDLLGKRFETDTGLDEAQEAEAIQILTSVWNIRESTSDTAPQKTIFVLNTLVMLYYLMMNSSKAQEYAERAFGLAKEHHLSVHEQSTIQELLSLISAEETHPVT
uniref:Zinc finger MYND-type containing 12 n=1 Tax=Lynx canadensis TaxID=61383 RepID=A0A667GJG5_LYNCA